MQKRTRGWTKKSDNEMVILEAELNYLEGSGGRRTIRRGHLKQLSDYILKERREVGFGGTFERALKRLEEKGAHTLEHKGTRKGCKTPAQTLIHLNPSKVQNLFDEKRRLFNIASARPDMRLGEENELEPDKWEKLVQNKLSLLFKEATKNWINLGDEKLMEINSISTDAAYQLAVNIFTRLFNIRIRPSHSKQLNLTEDEVWEFAKVTAKIASKNPTQPFVLTTDYSGYSMESPMWMEDVICRISPYIMKYADANNFKLTREEIEDISQGRIHILRPSLKALVMGFWKNHVVQIINDVNMYLALNSNAL